MPRNILFCTSEAVPFAKTGGLADVAGALPLALNRLGNDARLAMPLYAGIQVEATGPTVNVQIDLGDKSCAGRVIETSLPGEPALTVYMVDSPAFFAREGIYGQGGQDYKDNLERFVFFCSTVLEGIPQFDWQPDVVHCNDWQTALIPAYIKRLYSDHSVWSKCASVFTIHNLAYQGIFPVDKFPFTRLDSSDFTLDTLEFYGNVSLLKAGLAYADIITTVSPTYANEIQTEELGCGLDGLLRTRIDDLHGVLNGVDYGTWSPEVDTLIPRQYSPLDLSGKKKCKTELQIRLDLDISEVPIIGMVSRMVDQKGFGLLSEMVEELLELDVQFVLLGTGAPEYQQFFAELGENYPEDTGITLRYDDQLAHLIEAGSDIFVMPSRFEPCGLNQMYSLRYGTIPIVRSTGGLADTVVNTTPETLADETANGFVFTKHSTDALLDACELAIEAYTDRGVWSQLMKNGMSQEFSWEVSAHRYVELYEKAILRVR
ncbi:glycogen synthase GlgA [Candidatus Hydrogenedentota bacterium]